MEAMPNGPLPAGFLWGGALAGPDIIAFLPLVTRHAR